MAPRIELSLAQTQYKGDVTPALARQQISGAAGKLIVLRASLSQLDPKAVLERGYAMAIGPDGRAVRDAAALSPGDALRLGFARGSAVATVDQVVAEPEAD